MPKSARSVKSAKKPLKKRKNIPAKIVKKKPYFELATAFLSIPVLITVLLLNVTSLRNINGKPTPTPEPNFQSDGFFAAPIGEKLAVTPIVSANNVPCKKTLGPVSIATPGENDVVKDNPVTVNIEYDNSIYCGAAWSYRINGSSWSGYDDRSLALYNLPQGQIKFELRVKSIASSDETVVTRNFIYKGTSNTANNASDSAH